MKKISVSFFETDNFSLICTYCCAMLKRITYLEREHECERLFEETGPYWFITTESLDWLLYKTREEFITGTNIIATSAADSGLVIVGDIQMNNHHHLMGRGTLSQVTAFKDVFRQRSSRFQLSLGNESLRDWNIRIDPTENIRQFRNRIAYTDRNAYVVRKDSTPTGYPWGSGHLMFNGTLWMMNEGVAWGELSIDKRRAICRSHKITLPDSYRVVDGMIVRSSFVDYRCAEAMFNSANQYFSLLSRHGEADIEIAQLLGEGIQLPNEEVFQIVGSWHRGVSLKDLSSADKYGTAKKMKTLLASSNKQISQILQLPQEEVSRLFPEAL